VAGKRSTRAPLIAGSGPLAGVPPLVAFIAVIVLFGAGVLIKGVPGAALLGLLALGVAILLATAWRALTPVQRALRLIVLGVLIAVAVSVLNT
jgi:hypothetical protein